LTISRPGIESNLDAGLIARTEVGDRVHPRFPIRRVTDESPCQELTESFHSASSRAMLRFRDCRLARMSSGHYRLIRDLGPVKGGKGLRHHEVLLDLSSRGLVRFVKLMPRLTRPAESSRTPTRPAQHDVRERVLKNR
jgi:hypothetical protein